MDGLTAIVMAPGHITLKWCKEALQTIPRLRVFLIDGLRDRVRDGSTPSGVNEVKLRRGQIVREGLHTTLTDLRLSKNHRSARARWQQEICSGPAVFVVGRDKGKLSHFWRHAYHVARSGRYQGSVVNPDSGVRVEMGERWLIASDFRKPRLSEVIGGAGAKEDGADLKPRRPIYSPLWQADGKRIRRVAPLDFIGRFMPGWFDYAICDEAHQLANDTAQGNGLGTLAACADRTVILTGTLLAAMPAMSTIFFIGWRPAKWPPTDTSGVNRGCVPSPKPRACWKGLPPSSQPTTVARRRV
jgi:hypothetical protein